MQRLGIKLAEQLRYYTTPTWSQPRYNSTTMLHNNILPTLPRARELWSTEEFYDLASSGLKPVRSPVNLDLAPDPENKQKTRAKSYAKQIFHPFALESLFQFKVLLLKLDQLLNWGGQNRNCRKCLLQNRTRVQNLQVYSNLFHSLCATSVDILSQLFDLREGWFPPLPHFPGCLIVNKRERNNQNVDHGARGC